MLTEEQRERLKALGDEQLAIAEKMEAERESRLAILDRASAAMKAGDLAAYKKGIEEYLQVGQKDRCEHDRSIWSSCAGCEEIYRALQPELYCSKCGEEFDPMDDEPPLVKGMCDYCSQGDDDDERDEDEEANEEEAG